MSELSSLLGDMEKHTQKIPPWNNPFIQSVFKKKKRNHCRSFMQKRIGIENRCLLKCWKSFGYNQISKNTITTDLPGRRYLCQNWEGRESEHTIMATIHVLGNCYLQDNWPSVKLSTRHWNTAAEKLHNFNRNQLRASGLCSLCLSSKPSKSWVVHGISGT